MDGLSREQVEARFFGDGIVSIQSDIEYLKSLSVSRDQVLILSESGDGEDMLVAHSLYLTLVGDGVVGYLQRTQISTWLPNEDMSVIAFAHAECNTSILQLVRVDESEIVRIDHIYHIFASIVCTKQESVVVEEEG